MIRWRLLYALLLLTLLALPASAAAGGPFSVKRGVPPPQTPQIHVALIQLHDTLQPVHARVLAEQIDEANQTDARAILIDLSTPGGMSESVDTMVEAMRKSRLPIIVWTGQGNTRISGQGLRLLAEADVAMMGPNTFLTPLWSNPPRRLLPAQRTAGTQQLTKQLNAAVAEHGRSPEAIEELAGGVHWFSAAEAVQAGFVDAVAQKSEEVLHFASTRTIQRRGVTQRMDVASAHLAIVAMSPQNLMMISLMNPDLLVLVLTLGLLLIYLEINTPGTIVPGAAGVLMVLLAVFELSMLPVSGAGVVLCLVAALLLMLEARQGTHGLLATLGILALVGGLGTLVNGPVEQLQVSWGTAIGAGLGFGGVTAMLIVLGLEARKSKVKTGSEAMLGWLAVAQTPLDPDGQVLVRGELWRARLTSHDSFVAAGERVKVLRADGLTLEVTAIPL